MVKWKKFLCSSSHIVCIGLTQNDFLYWGRSLPKPLPRFMRGEVPPQLLVYWKGTFCLSANVLPI